MLGKVNFSACYHADCDVCTVIAASVVVSLYLDDIISSLHDKDGR